MRLGFFTEIMDDSDRRLVDLAGRLAASGIRLAGAVQHDIGGGADCACEMALRILGDASEPIRISQSLGAGSAGCRLDTGALEIAAARVAAQLARGQADMVILSKFGRQEALGRGFCQVIAQGLDAGLPVVLHVAPEQRAAFDAFAGDLAEEVAPTGLAEWCRSAVVPA